MSHYSLRLPKLILPIGQTIFCEVGITWKKGSRSSAALHTPKILAMSKSHDEIYQEFKRNVNMSPLEIEKWLDTQASKSVGQDSGDGESIGRKSAKKIIDIKRKKKDDLTNSDYEHMQKVNSYVSRHQAQKPSGDIEDTNWRYSLKNWGHDPMK